MKYFSDKVQYNSLTGKQQEIYNFQKVSAHLADYGYTTIKLADDWMGADFIAMHFEGVKYLKIQLKGRLTFDKRYKGKDLFICFPYDNRWIIYPHDELLEQFIGKIGNTSSWVEGGGYSYSRLSSKNLERLADYIVK